MIARKSYRVKYYYVLVMPETVAGVPEARRTHRKKSSIGDRHARLKMESETSETIGGLGA
jgi:hypothetical protein